MAAVGALRVAPIAALVLAVAVALLAGAALGGKVWARLDILTHFAPLYWLAGILALLLAVVLPVQAVKGGLALAGALSLLASSTLIAPEVMARWRTPTAPLADRTLTLLQFNAWGGNRESDRAIDWILAESPAIVVLQEGSDLRETLVKRGGYHLNCRGCDAAILSKVTPVRAGSAAPLAQFGDMISYATFRDADGEYSVVAVHKSWPIRFARLELERRELGAVLGGLSTDRIILAGDFNATPWSFSLRRLDRSLGLERRTRALATWPANQLSHFRLPALLPFMPIDHVYAGGGWATVSVRRGPRLGSDHYPVLVTLAPSAGFERTRPAGSGTQGRVRQSFPAHEE